MGLGRILAHLPQPMSRLLLPALRYLNLMRALELRLMARFVRRVEGWRILDVGCGHGLYSLDLARRGAQGYELAVVAHNEEKAGLQGHIKLPTDGGWGIGPRLSPASARESGR